MALLAEQLVDEWLNRRGFFTLRGIRKGVHEIDLLGIRPKDGAVAEAWHVEVSVSFRPVSYLGQLSAEERMLMGVSSANSAKKGRTDAMLARGIDAWVEKKFTGARKRAMREECCAGAAWRMFLVHGLFHDPRERVLIEQAGVSLIPFSRILLDLSQHRPGELSGAAGTDIAEIVRYFAQHGAMAE